MAHRDILVLGASSGGLEAVHAVLRTFPGGDRVSIFVVIHISPVWPSSLPQLIGAGGALRVVHPRDGDRIERGTVYVAPPNQHLLIEKDHVHLSVGPKENRFRPAIDPLFRSAALHCGPRVVGVVLSGALQDGAAGLYDIKRRGGIAIVQDPRTAAFPSMPWNALATVEVDHVVPIGELGALLGRITQEEVPAAEAPPVPAGMSLESRIVDMDPVRVEEMNSVGTPSGFVCPECQGSLWRLWEKGPARFRCHVGHGYVADSLVHAQEEQEEQNLWRTLQSMDERAAFMRQMASEALEDHRPDIAKTWEADLARLDVQAQSLRKLLGQPR